MKGKQWWSPQAPLPQLHTKWDYNINNLQTIVLIKMMKLMKDRSRNSDSEPNSFKELPYTWSSSALLCQGLSRLCLVQVWLRSPHTPAQLSLPWSRVCPWCWWSQSWETGSCPVEETHGEGDSAWCWSSRTWSPCWGTFCWLKQGEACFLTTHHHHPAWKLNQFEKKCLESCKNNAIFLY